MQKGRVERDSPTLRVSNKDRRSAVGDGVNYRHQLRDRACLPGTDASADLSLLLMVNDAIPPIMQRMGMFRVERRLVKKTDSNCQYIERNDHRSKD